MIPKRHTKDLFFCLLLVASFSQCISFLDPIVGGVGSLALFLIPAVRDQTYCRMAECCNDRSIPGDVEMLQNNLKKNLFGQHIILQKLIPAIRSHWYNEISQKPLVISFHGTPGTGKNYVADFVAEALYAEGLKSKFVHKYLGRADFPLQSMAPEYRGRINADVRAAIKQCPRSLFIFDEVDKMPTGVFESLASLLNHNRFLDGSDMTKSIFIFLSNTAGPAISDRLASLLKDGTLREDTKLSQFEQILEKGAYNIEGGMKGTDLIKGHVIDHYLPFLPLEKIHVKQCVEREFQRYGHLPHQNKVNEIMEESVTYDRTHGLFAVSGCKTLQKQVALHL